MSDRSTQAHHGIVPRQVTEIIVALDGGLGRRGSGYRVGPTTVLTAAHVLDGAVSVQVRFDADRPDEWITEVISCWTDPRCDLAVLAIAPREGEPPVTAARFGRISDQAAVLAVQAVGFPRFKLKTDDSDYPMYRDSHQAVGSVAMLSNRREGTLEITVPPPERDPDPEVSPWEGMSGAAVWVGDRIVGVIAKHHRSDGLGRLAAARLDLTLEGFDASRRAELSTLVGLPNVLPDVVPPSAGERVTTAYQAQVRDIAPDQLLDRETELDELVGFCAGDQPYAWWQAEPWAGKSALMSWFVLNPPAGVEVVSFFVTARLAGQSDSDACTDALIEQLAALAGESPAGLLGARARRGTMLQLLDDAARRSREAGRRLLVVIDGLDEDSGTTTTVSIAALLPRRPPPEVRVLIASRAHPPIPDDVADDHPLRRVSPRQLSVSEHARGAEHRAKHELRQLLAGEQLHRDVLGLITAAGGGLTLSELEELTERPPYEIRRLLGGLFGRSVGSRISSLAAERHPGEQVYLFTHETLRVVAEQQFGNSLAAYRDQLHVWADTWRTRGWPADTPQYLLRSYPRMLANTGHLARLVALATDPARHDRMRGLTGGDALAFTEISTAAQRVLAQPDLDLTSLAILAVQREHLTDRNENIPADLPAVWVRLGQPIRAEALAKGIADPDRRLEALARIAEAVAAGGDHDRADRLANETVALATQIPNLYRRVGGLVLFVVVAAARDNPDRAEGLAAQISDPYERALALARLAETAAARGDHDRATRLADETEALAAQIEPRFRGIPLARLAQVVAAGGDHDRAFRLADETEALVAQITDSGVKSQSLGELVAVVAAIGDLARAEALTTQISDKYHRARALTRIAETAAAGGDLDRAEALTAQITHPPWRAEMLARLAKVIAASGDAARVARLADETEALVGTSAEKLVRLAEAVAASGDLHRATRLAEKAEAHATQINRAPHRRAEDLASLAEAVAAGGDHDRAEVLAAQIHDVDKRERALTRLTEIVAAGGDLDRAGALTTQINDPYQRALALTRLAEAVAAAGDPDQAARLATETEGLITQIEGWYHPYRRALALTRLAETVAAAGDPDRAARLVTEAKALSIQIEPDTDSRAEVLVRLAETVAAAGDHIRARLLAFEAQALTTQILDSDWRVEVLVRLAVVAAVGGDPYRAVGLAAEITDPSARALALAQLTGAIAGRYPAWAARLATETAVLAAQIDHPGLRVKVLVRLTESVAAGGDTARAARLFDEAETLAMGISDSYWRTASLFRLAGILVKTGEQTSLVPQRARAGSQSMVRARQLIAEALVTISWTEPLTITNVGAILAQVDPLAVNALADELQVRWGLDSQTATGSA